MCVLYRGTKMITAILGTKMINVVLVPVVACVVCAILINLDW